MMDPPNLNLYQCLTTSTNRWTVERLSLHTLDAYFHFDLHHDLALYHHYGLIPLTWWFVRILQQALT
jgi:hypothetical protein